MADKDKLEQKSKTNVSGEELRDLALNTGISRISGRRIGHFGEDFPIENLSMIPKNARNTIYRDLLQLRDYLGLPKYQPATS